MSGQEPHRESVLLFSGAWFLYNFSYWVVMSYVPVHLTSLGMSHAAVGDCIATPALLTLLTVLPFGYLSDRLPARRLSQIGLALLTCWAIALPILPGGWPMFVAFGAAGLGMPLHLVSFNALFLKHLRQGGTGSKIGGFTMAQFLGFALGPMAVPVVQHVGGQLGAAPSVTFYAAAAGFAGAFVMTLLLHDPAQLPFHLTEYVGDIRSKRGALATTIILLYSLHFGAEQAFYPTFLREQCGMSQWGVGVVFAYSGILIGVVAVVVGRLFDRRGKMLTAMMLAMVFSGGFHAVTGLCDNLVEVLGVRTLHTIADGTLNCYITLFVAVTFPKHRVGGNFGFVYAVRTTAIFLAAMASGRLVAWGGLPMPFYATGILGAAGGLTFLMFRPKLKAVMGEA